MKFRNRVGRFLPDAAVANQCGQSQRERQTTGRCLTNAGYNTHISWSSDRLVIELTLLQTKFDSILSSEEFGPHQLTLQHERTALISPVARSWGTPFARWICSRGFPALHVFCRVSVYPLSIIDRSVTSCRL
jgi:hypothetical protein